MTPFTVHEYLILSFAVDDFTDLWELECAYFEGKVLRFTPPEHEIVVKTVAGLIRNGLVELYRTEVLNGVAWVESRVLIPSAEAERMLQEPFAWSRQKEGGRFCEVASTDAGYLAYMSSKKPPWSSEGPDAT